MYKVIDVCGGLYKVSDKGEVFNYRTNVKIKQHKSRDGYCVINVGLVGNRSKRYVHRLVAEAFIPTDKDIKYLTVNHKDYNKENNNVNNLEWLTREDNAKDSYKNPKGHSNIGEKHKNAKLSKDNVINIKKMLENHTDGEIAYIYGVSPRAIYDIRHNIT